MNLRSQHDVVVVGGGTAGILAGGLASIVEHYEFYPIDDNVTVPLVSFLVSSQQRLMHLGC